MRALTENSEETRMRVTREDVTRREVICFYAAYDCRKKKRSPPPDIDTWPWHDPDGLDQRLCESGLKKGILAAYLTWRLVKFSVADFLECAIVNQVFPRLPQALSQLVCAANWLSGCLTVRPIGGG